MLWSRMYPGELFDGFTGIAPAGDGGYIAIGYANSGTTAHGLISKIGPTGDMVWMKTVDVGGGEYLSSITPVYGGKFLVSGYLGFSPGPVLPAQTSGPLVKVDSDGTVLWHEIIGLENGTQFNAVASTRDGISCAAAGGQNGDAMLVIMNALE